MNNFAITSAGIGEALQRSASALYAAGNTLDESVALVTAANSVIQNPEQVGTALKTLALRLRGAKTELEEAGLETDNMAESTSTLQAKLNALTHGKVDIMLDADTFKNTTQILREMSAAWEDMTDIERASALELMGGKRQANILASVITNFETVEDVIETSMNSSGSAIAENEKWLDSIEGKTYQFTNALQTMWSNMIDSEMVKSFIDFGTDAIQFLDTGAGKVIALVAALKLMAKFKGFSIKGIAQGLGDTIKNITTAQQTLQTLSQTSPIGKGYDLTNVQAYAQAVSNLTAKQQANLLASQGLNKEQIKYALTLNQVDDAAQREVMAHVRATTAKQQSADADKILFQNKMAYAAQSLATEAETTKSATKQAAADFLKANASKAATIEEMKELITTSNLTAAEKAEALATLQQTMANKGLAASIKAIYAANPIGFWITLVSTVLSLIPVIANVAEKFTKSAEEIKQEAKEITQAYTDAIDEINNNLKTLGITDDSDSIASLEREFASLTAGVDKYGNNISLTSDQYERYKEICEQIVGINPLIARGYDSATEAIGDNASVLSELIELQKEQARMAAEEYVNDESFTTLAKDAKNDYDEAVQNAVETRNSANEKLHNAFKEILKDDPIYGLDTDDNGTTKDETMEYVLKKLGYDADAIKETVDKYWDDNRGLYNINKFWTDYRNEIADGAEAFGADYNEIVDVILDGNDEIEAAEKRLQDSKEGFVDELLIVPKSDKDYDKLTSEGKNFLVDWIKNSTNFDVGHTFDEDDVEKMKENIYKMIDVLVDDTKNFKYNGEKLTAQELLSKIYSFDASSVDYETYKAQINEMLTAFWNAIGGENNDYGYEDFEDFQISFGFNFVEADGKLEEAKTTVAGYLNVSTEEIQQHLNNMNAAQIKAFYSITWSEVGSDGIGSWYDVMERVNSALNGSNITSVQTYSVLSEEVDKFKEILTQTSEIVADNTEVTQEYKDSLTDLGISEEELSECFDDQNPLIVKNAKALNKLVKEANKNVAANVKLAKSNARLDYYQLVKQLSGALDGTKKLDAATRDSVYSTLEQIDAVERALYQYQLLEDTLLGVNNAFEEFADAQEIDSLNTYGDSYVEMVQTLYDGWYKTGQVGTEAFQTALNALVPPDISEGLDDAEKLRKQYEYFNKYVLPTGRLDEDQFSLDYDSMESFVKKGIKDGVFTGDIKDFDLVKDMKLDDAAEKLGYTREQTYALFAELDKYNVAGHEHSFLSQLDDSLEGRITNITNDIEELNRKKLALLEDGGYDDNKEKIQEIDKEIQAAEKDLNTLGQEAYTTWQEYTANEAALAALEETSDKSQKLSEVWPKELITDLGLNGDMTVEEAYNRLLAKQLELEEPTVLTAQLAIDNIDTKIAELEEMLKDPKTLKVEAETQGKTPEELKKEIEQQIQSLQEDKAVIATKFGIELSEEDKKTLEDELNKIEEFTINDKSFKVVANGTSETMQSLRNINNYTIGNKTYTVTTKYQDVGNNTTRTSGSGGRYTRVDGTAHANGSWGAPRTETALVGELGPEMLVRNGRWTTVGDNGAEFTQVKKGDIIFNHKQTEELLSKGYVAGRGKAYASGTAYSGLWKPTSPNTSQSNKPGNDFTNAGNRLFNAADSISGAADSLSSSASDAADEFREVFDWIEVRLEEINEDINLRSAQLENKIGHKNQNKTVDQIIDLNQKLYDNLIAGSKKYYSYANKLLSKVPAEYREAAKDGTIAIEAFVGEADEKTLEAIQEYREWVQKGDEAAQQAEETLTEISNLAKQAVDNIAQDYDNKRSLRDNKIDQYEAYNEFLETDQGFESASIYQAMIQENNKIISGLEKQRNEMQTELNKRVESGEIKKYSQDWYDAVNDIAAVDTEIIELKTDTENYQDAINELHWEKFDALMSRIEMVSEETENMIDILGNKDLVDESGNWTDEGIASLGLYAQQMEAAEVQAKKYQEEIDYLNKNWKKLGYTEEEYIEKLDELKSGQYDAIQAYHDSKDAIVDLNKERIDAIKEGIEKEIDAYSELIEKKKEELDAEKDLYDFQKSIMEQEKDVADIQRKLAALSADNSASARAKRAKLEAELAEAQAKLEESYYDRSISNQQEALDKELENFKEEKDAEKEGWDKYLENTEQVVADSLATIQTNTDSVYQALQNMAQEYGLNIENTITSTIIDPWSQGIIAIQSFSEQFGISMSATVDELNKLELEFLETMATIEKSGTDAVGVVKESAEGYASAEYKAPAKEENSGGGNSGSGGVAGLVSSLSGNIQYGNTGSKVKKLQQALNELGYGNSGTTGLDGIFGDKTLAAVKKFQKDMKIVVDGIVGPETKKKFKVKGYASGTHSLKKSGIVNLDEIGDELILRAQNGRLSYLEKGSGVVPADLTSNLMEWGKLDPTSMLEQNKPSIGVSPEIHNTEIHVDNSIGELIHIDNCSTETIQDVKKIVNEALEKHTQKLNNSIRRYAR